MVQTLVRCGSCGLPGKLAENLEWSSDGVIISRQPAGVRLAMLDVETMDRLYHGLIAEGLRDFYLNEKGATRYLVGELFSGLIGEISRYDNIKKRVLKTMEDFSLLLGMGRIEVERFAPKQKGTLVLKKPFNLCLVMACIAGIMEGVDGCCYTSIHTDLGGEAFHLTLDASEDDDYRKDSFKWLSRGLEAAECAGTLGRCDLCGLPLALKDFRWDELYGVVEEGAQARRVGLLPYYTLAVMGKMASETRKENTAGLIEEAFYISTLERIEGGAGNAPQGPESLEVPGEDGPSGDIWNALRIRGWGAASEVRIGEREWRVTIVNPIDVSLLAGWLRALYSVSMGREPRLSVIEEPPSAHYCMD